MKPLWSTAIAAAMIFSIHNCSYADVAAHKEALKKSEAAVKEVFKSVKESKFYPAYHAASSAYLMGKPSGLTYFNGEYHLFFQHNPNSLEAAEKNISHFSSPDLIHWINKPTALSPSETYDKDGVLAGSAIVEDEILYLIYTGNVVNKKEDKTENHQTQNLAISKDGVNFGKSANNSIIQMAPHYMGLNFSSADFRNPYVWKQSDRYYALIGTQYEKTKDGAVLLFKSKDLRNWVFINVVALGAKGEMGYMWESPSLFHINGEDVLVICPQGIAPHGKMFLNKYQAGWFVGKLDYDTGKFKQKGAFGLFDYGFDFYAPTITKTQDGKYILIAQMDMPDKVTEHQSEKWAGMMTLPREITVKNGKVVTVPFAGVELLRDNGGLYKEQKITGEKSYNSINGDVYEMDLEADMSQAKSFAVKLRTSSTQETVLSYDKESKILKLNRDKSSDEAYNIKGEREVKLPLTDNLLNLRIFVDKSSVEIFANNGQAVLSSRIYPDKHSTGVKFVSDGETVLNHLNFYKLKYIH